jgi:hypothetical protein
MVVFLYLLLTKTDMTTFLTSQEPRSLPSLPEQFPAISVGVDVGEELKAAGRTIEVDPHALNTALMTSGVPQDKLATVGVKVALKTHSRGGAYLDAKTDLPLMDVMISAKDVGEGNATGTQKTVVHEGKHVADYIDIASRNGTEVLKEKGRRAVLLEKVSGVAGAIAVGTVCAFAMRHIPSSNDAVNMSDLAKDVAILSAGATGNFFGNWLSYRLGWFERRAFKAEKAAGGLPKIISLPKTPSNDEHHH